MIVNVTKNQVLLEKNYIINRGEYNINPLYFEFSEEYTDNLVKKAVFAKSGSSPIEVSILNNQCNIPSEVLDEKNFELRVYAYEVENDELVLRYSPAYAIVHTMEGSYVEGAVSPTPITPTQFEEYMQAMNDGLNEVANVDIDASKSGTVATVTITDRDGIEKTIQIYDGEKGDRGDRGPQRRTTVFRENNGEQGVQGVQGPQGEPFTIKKTYSSVAAMNADFANMQLNDYVMIASSVETPDNAKMYVRGEVEWIFITDFSGATGIQGEQGPQR